MAKSRKKSKWIRSGTILAGGVTQIDIEDQTGNWITVKGNTDADSERLADLLLKLLNTT